MKRTLSHVSLALALAMVFSAGLQRSTNPTAAAAADPAGVEVVTAADGLTVSVHIPEFSVESHIDGSDSFDRLAFAGQSGLTGDPGAPALPFYSFLVAAPAGAEASLLDLRYDSRVESRSYAVAPAPNPRPLTEDLTPGEFDLTADPERYASGALYPSAVVQVAGDAWIRGQRVLRIVVYPFQYNAAESRLTVNSEIRFRIAFEGSVAGTDCTDCRYTPALETALENQIVNYDQGLGWRAAIGSDALSDQIQSPGINPFLGPRFEIVVVEDGVYHLTYADMEAAGMDVDNVNPQTFRLVNQGQDVAIFVSGEGNGSFDPGEFVAFYGERFRGDVMEARYENTMTKPSYDPEYQSLAPNNWFWQCEASCELASYFERYTEDNIYYLIAGGPAGPRMSTLSGTPGGAAIAASYFETVRAEIPIHWWSHEWYDDDVWFWDRFQGDFTPRDYPITLTDLAAGAFNATVNVELSSRSHNPEASPDHHSKIEINDFLLDDHYWDGRIRYAFSGQVSQNELVEGVNELTLTLVNDTALPIPDMYFDFFEITYAREFVAVDDQLNFAPSQSGTWRFQVTGLTSGSVEVYRITNPLSPVRITGATVNAGTATFQVTDGASSRYIVAGTGAGVLTPESITFYDPPDFENMAEAEYVVITHANFLAGSQTLANHRAAQGYSVAVIDIADLYHEFNDGIYHPIAIKNFLAWTFENWSSPVDYAVLVGNGNWNMRNFGNDTKPYHNAPPTFMPPNLAYVDPWQGEVDSSNLLATIIGNDTVPDVFIGRIPVQTSTEMQTVVGKIIGYETAGFAEWNKNFLFIADNIPDQAGNFIALAEGIISDYIEPNQAYNPLRIYQDDGNGIPNDFDFGCTSAGSPECQALRAALFAAINNGVLIVNYIGHASLNRWSSESIFLNSDVPALNNATKLPFFLSMTCLDGHWSYPNLPSLTYVLLTTPGKGAVGSFASTGLGVATGHDPLQRGFYTSMMDEADWQVGPASTSAKLALWATGNNQDLAQTFMVFGDPALGLKNGYNVSLTPLNGTHLGDPGTNVIHTLTVKNTGGFVDTYSIQIAGGSWPTVPSTTTVGPLNPNQSAQVQITVSIPPSALGDELSVSTVTAASQSTVHTMAIAQIKTIIAETGIFLPIIFRNP